MLTDPKDAPLLLGLDLVEGRDVGRWDGQNGSSRMPPIPRDIRANVNLQEWHACCGRAELISLMAAVGHLAQPPTPPLMLLREATREQVEQILAAKGKALSQTLKRRSGKEASERGGMAHAAHAAQRAAQGAVADAAAAAVKARRTAAVAVQGAERAAVAAQKATQSATQALGGARRSGQAAAEKALGHAASSSKKALGSLGGLMRGNLAGKLTKLAATSSSKTMPALTGPTQAAASAALTLEEQEELEFQQAAVVTVVRGLCFQG